MIGQVYANAVRRVLVESIETLNANKQQYVLNPEKDLQRRERFRLIYPCSVRLTLRGALFSVIRHMEQKRSATILIRRKPPFC